MPEIIEPFRIKSVEPIRFTTREDRERILRDAKYNPFLIDADDVLIDLLTDSGTSAMSAAQWGAIMTGDESYAGSRSFRRFEAKIQEIFGFKHVIPTHQGRAAEKILMAIAGGSGKIIPNNNHFDTTRANVEFTGAEALDLVIEEGKDPDHLHPFKGNLDLEKLKTLLSRSRDQIPLGMVTVTNNTGGGQPVSMANIKAIAETLHANGKPFIIDSCRFAENAWFIKQREDGYQDKTPLEIAQEMFSHADGATMSLKKDGFGNIGGFLALNDDALAEQARNILILTEGFPTYGGLAGRDLEALAQGLDEVLDPHYLEYRVATVRYLANKLIETGVKIVQPPGGHAVYIDAKRFYSQIPAEQFPAQVFVNELYVAGGIRGVEIGSVMFGRCIDGVEHPADRELVRLALPRRVYTQAHVNYVADVIAEMFGRRDEATGLRITKQAPFLRHFTAELSPL
ncbi:MAG: tyrosine phenol-lyase [Armatimonadetes bacterium 55-13]|nr:tryptophanase [Armatimonadota bacterium]OJU65553.1 MAG: tyrosine phenol-lyase [Armatimonadetes bacterium 55-13]